MLVRDDRLCIGQASHAWVSGQLARAWAAPFSRHEEVCLAAEQHDIGMAEWDVRPELDPETGLPRSFMRMRREVHLALWREAPHKLLSQSRYAALLVSLHGTGLLERFPGPPAERELIDAHLAEQRALQERLARETGADPDELAAHRALIATWDTLSLAVCLGWPPRELDGGLRLEPGPSVSPWPFRDEAVTVRCEGVRLRGGPFADDAGLHAALDAAPVEQLVVELRRRP